jgi:hypothetical protein
LEGKNPLIPLYERGRPGRERNKSPLFPPYEGGRLGRDGNDIMVVTGVKSD